MNENHHKYLAQQCEEGTKAKPAVVVLTAWEQLIIAKGHVIQEKHPVKPAMECHHPHRNPQGGTTALNFEDLEHEHDVA